MQMSPYLDFNGDCEAAFTFYETCFGGKLGPIFRYAGSPLADQVPPDWQEKVMHASVSLGGVLVMGADFGRRDPSDDTWRGSHSERIR